MEKSAPERLFESDSVAHLGRLSVRIQGLKFGVSYSVSTVSINRNSGDVRRCFTRMLVLGRQSIRAMSIPVLLHQDHKIMFSQIIRRTRSTIERNEARSVDGTSGRDAAFHSRLKGGEMDVTSPITDLNFISNNFTLST